MAKINGKTIKIVVTGPESTGKTTLSKALAEHLNTSLVPEFAREYLNKTDGKYEKEDLLEIAKGQIKIENEAASDTPELLICDTSLEVIRVWSEWKYKACDSFILEQAKLRVPDLFLLLKPDIPWKEDPLRENPTDREALYQYYLKTLEEYNAPIIELRGDDDKRLNSALKAINEIV
ncbi:MAG: ATP-binding protein [Bacteroidota bacterium]